MEEGNVTTEGKGQTAAATETSLAPRPDATSLASVPPAQKGNNALSGVRTEATIHQNRPNEASSNVQKSISEEMKVKIMKPKDVLQDATVVTREMNDITASAKSSLKPPSEKSEKKKKEKMKKQGPKKVRKEGNLSGKKSEGGPQDETGAGDDGDNASSSKKPGPKKGKKKKEELTLKNKKHIEKLSPAQTAVKDMMRQLLEEDKYSVQGSIVDTDSSDEEEDEYAIYAVSGGTGSHKRGMYNEEDATLIHLDRSVIVRAARKRLRIEGMKGMIDMSSSRKRANNVVIMEDTDIGNQIAGGDAMIADDSSARRGRKKKKKKGKRNLQGLEDMQPFEFIDSNQESQVTDSNGDVDRTEEQGDDVMGIDESSIFGQTTGSSNATWVECDKCKKWRRLRGIVDAKKLPPKWYCTMNKNDPERARCSAPEEEYETPITPETISDQRARKHLRLWVRRLQCNENFEARLPTMTRGKRRNATNPKDPYEWVRCCNPSCGKWRAVLRSMDASSVIDAARNGEWYCVLNTWDEKTASCAAPQENLPAIGCPPWVMQNED